MDATNDKTQPRKMWRFGNKRKRLAPQGKVPEGVKGLTKAIGGGLASERSKKWETEERSNVSNWVTRSPAWAISLALHFVAGVILMNVVYFTQHDKLGQVFRMTLRAAQPGGDHQGEQDNGINGKDNEDSKPAGPEKPDTEVASDPKPANIKPTLPDPGASTMSFPLKVVAGEMSGKDGPGGIYAGRGGAGRGEMLRQFGGDGQSEQAVVDGLAWLAKHQSKSGAWDPDRFDVNCPRGESCGGDDKGERMYAGATTGLAILAYLGAGYSHMDDHLRPADQGGPVTHQYTATIKKALAWLCREQDEKTGAIDPEGDRNMYVHGIASLAVIEAYSMTKDPGLRPHAQRCVMHIVEAQQDSGGWNYTPEPMSRSDTSITSWMVMCLRSARAAGLAVPKRVWDRSRFFMSKVTNYQTGNVGYCIQGGNGKVTPGCNCMVAVGMATRAYLGIPDDQVISEKFVDTILKAPPRYDETAGACPNWGGLQNRKGATHWSLYYNYYATLALFHHGGKAWEEWNSKMRACTIPAQRKDGHALGSWDPVVWDGAWGGRVYTTAFNIMNLEVYYRYLPCYQVGAEFGLQKLVTDEEWDKVTGDARNGKFGEIKGTAEEGTAEAPPKTGTPDKPVAPRAERDAESLISDLKSDQMMVRRNAAKELSSRHELSAVDALIQQSKIEKTSLRPVLIEYLGAFGDSDAIISYLIETLDNAEDRLQQAALTALRRATGETSIGKDARAWRSWWTRQQEEKSKTKK
ncbi:MAG: HEAT repeat domain-containing protein [Planctomycetes bacterium]|nr:HEAT repeat domain-containing protein [Planctomycetota bacterium]